MAEAARKTKKRSRKRDRPHRGQRRLLKDVLRATAANAEDQGTIDPVYALQVVLDRTYSWLTYAADRVERLDEKKLWRNTTGVGRIPHEWIRLERDLRAELAYLSARMLDLDIEDRKAQAAEIVATAIAPVLEGVLSDLKLTSKQRAQAKKVVANRLRLLEGPPKLRDVSEAD
jgi:hypothetical protein